MWCSWSFWPSPAICSRITLGLLTASGPVGTESPMQTMFADERFWLVFLFIPPLLTMRLFAEERSSGTLEMLMTAPLRDWQVVLCKYLACLAFYTVLWLPTLLYLPALLGAQQPVCPQRMDAYRASRSSPARQRVRSAC